MAAIYQPNQARANINSAYDRDQSLKKSKRNRQNPKSPNSNRVQCTNSLKFTFVLQFFVLITLIDAVYGTCFSRKTKLSCIIAVYPTIIGYLLAKWALYMVLSYRLDASFATSALAYKKRTMIIWRIFLTLSVILEIIVTLLMVKIDIVYDDNVLPCRGSGDSTVSTILTLLVDSIAGIVNCLLFIRPLKKIDKAVQERCY